MSTPTDYTAGAYRAARLIDNKVLRYESVDIERRPVEWLAEIIDRETHVKELVKSLETILGDYLELSSDDFGSVDAYRKYAYNKAKQALALAKGE